MCGVEREALATARSHIEQRVVHRREREKQTRMRENENEDSIAMVTQCARTAHQRLQITADYSRRLRQTQEGKEKKS